MLSAASPRASLTVKSDKLKQYLLLLPWKQASRLSGPVPGCTIQSFAEICMRVCTTDWLPRPHPHPRLHCRGGCWEAQDGQATSDQAPAAWMEVGGQEELCLMTAPEPSARRPSAVKGAPLGVPVGLCCLKHMCSPILSTNHNLGHEAREQKTLFLRRALYTRCTGLL